MSCTVSRQKGLYTGIVAVFVANLFLVLTLAGQNPDLHALLHYGVEAEGECHEEACVIDLVSGGHVLASDPVGFSRLTVLRTQEFLPPLEHSIQYLTEYLFVLAQGPPPNEIEV